jgi:hypothetical protein
MSTRSACALFGVARFSLKRTSTLDVKGALLMNRMAALAAKHPRFGYRRVRELLRREGTPMSCERALRLWQKSSLQVPKKRRRRVPSSSARPVPAAAANQVWAWDFVHDACANGQSLKCLTVVDEHTRCCRSRSAGVPALRQRPRVRRAGGAGLAARRGNPERDHRARQALAERRERELQWQVPRRMPRRRMVPDAARGPRRHRELAPSRKRRASAQQPRLPDTVGVRAGRDADRDGGRMSIVVATLADAGLVSLSRAPWDSFPRGRGPLPGSAVARPVRPAPLQRDDDSSRASACSSRAALRTATGVTGVRASTAGLGGGRGRNSRNGWSQNSEQVRALQHRCDESIAIGRSLLEDVANPAQHAVVARCLFVDEHGVPSAPPR